ncbi:MAG: hypothetical protein OEY86_20135 [Nitrospira sp.]|nr:hypothetical protein [Nitrospira sp.]
MGESLEQPSPLRDVQSTASDRTDGALSGHYSEGRRWSHISNAWILEASWNNREEVARLLAENAQLKAELEQAKQREEKLRGALDHANKRPNIMTPSIGYGEGRSSLGVFELCNPEVCKDPKHAHMINGEPCPKEVGDV